MGLSRCAIYVKGADETELLGLARQLNLIGTGSTESRPAAEQSEIGDDEFGIAVQSGWGVLFLDSGPMLDFEMTPMLSSASIQRQVFMWLTQSTSGGLWFEFHQGGRLARKWVEVEGEVVESFGPPLDQEPPGLFPAVPDTEGERDEWSVLAVAAAMTGISEDQLFSMPFSVFPIAKDLCE